MKPVEEQRYLVLDNQQKEKILFQNQMLHYGLYTPKPDDVFYGEIPWHWHDEFEFGYIMGGSILYRTNQQEYLLEEGDGIFVNSGVLHALHPIGPIEKIRLQSQFFDKSFLAGASGSLLDMQYLAPVQEQKALDAVPLYGKNPKDAAFLRRMCESAELGIRRERFFELRMRSIFSELWETVYSWAEQRQSQKQRFDVREDERIKSMMLYIQEHYSEKLTIQQIAAHIPVSERECHRLFQNCLGSTPFEYIAAHRLQKAQELLMYTDKSVLDIALETGFGTSSYFGKIFRQHYHMSPGQYRRFSGFLPRHTAQISKLDLPGADFAVPEEV